MRESYTAMSRSRSVHSFMLGLFCSPSHRTISRSRAGQGRAGQGREGKVVQEKERKRDKSERCR
jgi:hypothetical protein